MFFPQNQFTPAIWDYIRPEFVRFIHVGWLFFVWSSSAQISMGGHLNLDGGDAKSRWGDANSRWGDASPVQFKYWLYNIIRANYLTQQTEQSTSTGTVQLYIQDQLLFHRRLLLLITRTWAQKCAWHLTTCILSFLLLNYHWKRYRYHVYFCSWTLVKALEAVFVARNMRPRQCRQKQTLRLL